jgi:hypothetical protein
MGEPRWSHGGATADSLTCAVTSRRLWQLYEPIHGVVYFNDEVRTAAADTGYQGFWMGYFAFRAAPLGAVGPEIATAAFFGFHPSRARRALPDAWTLADPQQALTARATAAADVLRRVHVELDDTVEEAADMLWVAAQAADTAGRVLGAANQALPRPADPVEALWQAATTLREHRGDGHLAADIAPLHAHVLKIAATESDEDALRLSRNWPDDEWAAATQELASRGWTTPEMSLTARGATVRDDVEARTDASAAAPWRILGEAGTLRLAALLEPITRAVLDAQAFPMPNPVGLSSGHP